MKKTSTLFFSFFTAVFSLSAQPLLVENFEYSGLLTSNGWRQTGNNSIDPISTTDGLVYENYLGSGVGNAAAVFGANQDVAKLFTAVNTEGATIYMSAMIKVTDEGANTGGYFLHLGDSTSTSNFSAFAGRVYAKTDAEGGVFFGTSNNSTPVYGTTRFEKNTTYLVVLKYTMSLLGNDDLQLWVLSSGVPVDEASLGTPEATNTITNGYNEINAVGIRQSASIPDVIVDGLRIGTQYTDVVVLPLTLTSLNGSLVENGVNLNWTSANEVNVIGFSIERSKDGVKFETIGTVNATNASQANYTFTDAVPNAGTNYYRLVTKDKDGAVKYSTVITVVNGGRKVKLAIFPNPVMNNLVVSHTKAVKEATIAIYSGNGSRLKIANVQSGAIQSSLMVSDLRSGNYILIFQNGTERSVVRFVK